MKARTFYNNTYGVWIHLLVPATLGQFQSYVRRVADKKYEAEEGVFEGIAYRDDNHVIIALREWDSSPESIGVLGHEVFHAAYGILFHRDIEINNATEEVLAYLFGSLLSRSLEALKT